MVYDNVKRYADERNLPLTVLEVNAGLGRGTIGKWKNQAPMLRTLTKVAKALGVTVSDLLEEADAVPKA